MFATRKAKNRLQRSWPWRGTAGLFLGANLSTSSSFEKSQSLSHSRSRQLPNPAPERGSWRIEIDRTKNDRERRAISTGQSGVRNYKETAANHLKSVAGEEISDVFCLFLCCCASYSDILIVACEPRFH